MKNCCEASEANTVVVKLWFTLAKCSIFFGVSQNYCSPKLERKFLYNAKAFYPTQNVLSNAKNMLSSVKTCYPV